MKILFISYYFDPFPGVGAKRVSYWADNIHKHDIESTVITATKQVEDKDNVIFIAPSEKINWKSKIFKDEGLFWNEKIKTYFDRSNTNFSFDYVLISGGPFLHFGVANYLKRKFGAKIILDFRDPFSRNPSFKDGLLKIGIKKIIERSFLKSADYLTVVNSYCEKLVVKTNVPVKIIDNGYDDTELKKTTENITNSKFTIAHAGTFINGVRNPENLFNTLKTFFNDNIEFVQFGKDSDYFTPYRDCKFFNYGGFLSYKELMSQLINVDACVLVTQGQPFESTTKVYDYIGLNKRILIVTDGGVKTGNLHEITKDYPNVVWANNNCLAIKKAIIELQEMKVVDFDSYNYSRANGLEKLVKLLKELKS